MNPITTARARVMHLLNINGIDPARVSRADVSVHGYWYIDMPVKWVHARKGGWTIAATWHKWPTPPDTTQRIIAAIFHLNRMER